jgi:hypothetical protein
MDIVAEYDSSMQNAPAAYKAAIQAAINYMDRTITNNITVPIMFSYGEIEGQKMASDALGESDTNGNIESYSSLVGYLTAAATSQADFASLAALPATDPTNGARFWVSDAEAQVFGLGSEPGYTDPEDGFVALSSAYNFTYDPHNRSVSGEYDAIGVIEHEITEAMGRISYLGQGSFDNYTLYSPLDLFRYSSAGVHDLHYEGAYFSVNGQTMLLPYNNPSNGGDGGDWASSVVGDSFGDGYDGLAGYVSRTDLQEMDLLGFQIASPLHTDFNADDFSDILIEGSNGQVVVGEASAAGALVYSQVGGLGSNWTFVGSGDFLAEGHSQFLIENTVGQVVVGDVVNGQAQYTQVAGLGSNWTFVGVGDFVGALADQFLIESTSGQVDIGQVGTNHQAAYTQIATLGPEWSFEGTGDFLGEGHDQFLIENTSGAVVVGDFKNGQTVYTQVTALGPEWKFEGAGDFLGDGKSDFLIENTSGAVVLGEVGANGQTAYTQIAALGPEWSFKGTGDYLGDGHFQFLIENTSGAVVVGNVVNGQAVFTQIGALGLQWQFHS